MVPRGENGERDTLGGWHSHVYINTDTTDNPQGPTVEHGNATQHWQVLYGKGTSKRIYVYIHVYIYIYIYVGWCHSPGAWADLGQAGGAGEDGPAKEPLWTQSAWSPVHGTPISRSRWVLLQMSQAYHTQRRESSPDWKSSENPPGLQVSWCWSSYLQPHVSWLSHPYKGNGTVSIALLQGLRLVYGDAG